MLYGMWQREVMWCTICNTGRGYWELKKSVYQMLNWSFAGYNREWTEAICEVTIAEDFSEFLKDINPQNQKLQWISNTIKKKKTTPRYR